MGFVMHFFFVCPKTNARRPRRLGAWGSTQARRGQRTTHSSFLSLLPGQHIAARKVQGELR